ncbi:hypothetical protein E3N88_07391 [Mikania micrantha]|uniref:Reverse transcriptase Ty1/copia-type domain-containing protein n=1 Tax=Mikania micrantha TaxID=192012 RepID=A0A5N6PTI9_9ASTR|nr:hypothetical protein E3N88_07391 [Mikania micrantha]
MLDVSKGSIVVSRDVTFEESRSWEWGTSENNKETEFEGPRERTYCARFPNVFNSSNPARAPEETYDDSPPQGFKSLEEVYDLLLAEEEQVNFKEAAKRKEWAQAMEEEMASIERNKTWRLVNLPKGCRPIGLKWVYKIKKDARGQITRHKARLVSKGYIQQHGVEYNEVFAPVARLDCWKLCDWFLHWLPKKAGFEKQGQEDKVYRLTKALYGLKQAPRAQNTKLDGVLRGYGFTRCKLEQAELKTATPQNSPWNPGSRGKEELLGYSDSSYSMDQDDGKGTTGVVFYFNEMPITWSSQKQQTVAQSSCEAEFMAATAAACQAIWLRGLLAEITGEKEQQILIKVDNKSAIALMKNPVFHGRSKHINTGFHYIRECVEREQIKVEHISEEEQRADILTKALPKIKFSEMRDKLGMEEIEET